MWGEGAGAVGHSRCGGGFIQEEGAQSHHVTPVRMVIINKSTNNKCWRGCGDLVCCVIGVHSASGYLTLNFDLGTCQV